MVDAAKVREVVGFSLFVIASTCPRMVGQVGAFFNRLFVHVHCTLYSVQSVGWLVGHLAGMLVGW